LSVEAVDRDGGAGSRSFSCYSRSRFMN
jgi:hypothetical protein